MYNLLYTGEIIVSEDLYCDDIAIPFSVQTNGPITEVTLKQEVIKQLPSKYTCIKHLTYKSITI